MFRRGEVASVPQRPDADPVVGVLAVEALEAVETVPDLQVGGQLVLVVDVDVLVVLLVRRFGVEGAARVDAVGGLVDRVDLVLDADVDVVVGALLGRTFLAEKHS